MKSRHVLEDGKLHLLVRDSELSDPRAVIIAVVLDINATALHPIAICVDVPTFRRLAFERTGSDHGYQASIPMPPPPSSRWHPFAVPINQLSERVCPARPSVAAIPRSSAVASPPAHGFAVGYRGEARLLAVLAGDDRLNTFKAFPDLELVEYVVRHRSTGGIAGIQVKAISVDAAHPHGTVKVPPGTFIATPCTYFAVPAEHRADHSLHPQCLLIPSMDIGDLLDEHSGELTLSWDPDSSRRDADVAPYRCPVSGLAGRLAALLEHPEARS